MKSGWLWLCWQPQVRDNQRVSKMQACQHLKDCWVILTVHGPSILLRAHVNFFAGEGGQAPSCGCVLELFTHTRPASDLGPGCSLQDCAWALHLHVELPPKLLDLVRSHAALARC